MSYETQVLVSHSVAEIVTFYRPGSQGDDWTWAAEYAYCIDGPDREKTERIDERVRSEGISFIDDVAPVLLGSDGRVWDGHHRICLAIKHGIHALMCEVATATAPIPDQHDHQED